MGHPLHALATGSVFAGEFRIVRLLGEGGMGAVYVAEQLSTGKLRALKTMHAQLVSNAPLRDRFVLEAHIGSRIDSEHVVDVVAAGVDQATGMPWLAMELLQGETLGDVVARGLLDRRCAEEALLQLGVALESAHAAGVVHRDLKPENVFLTRTRHHDVPFVLKVLDFGIAKLLQPGASCATQSVGTPLWMAPEQTELGAKVTPASLRSMLARPSPLASTLPVTRAPLPNTITMNGVVNTRAPVHAPAMSTTFIGFFAAIFAVLSVAYLAWDIHKTETRRTAAATAREEARLAEDQRALMQRMLDEAAQREASEADAGDAGSGPDAGDAGPDAAVDAALTRPKRAQTDPFSPGKSSSFRQK